MRDYETAVVLCVPGTLHTRDAELTDSHGLEIVHSMCQPGNLIWLQRAAKHLNIGTLLYPAQVPICMVPVLMCRQDIAQLSTRSPLQLRHSLMTGFEVAHVKSEELVGGRFVENVAHVVSQLRVQVQLGEEGVVFGRILVSSDSL